MPNLEEATKLVRDHIKARGGKYSPEYRGWTWHKEVRNERGEVPHFFFWPFGITDKEVYREVMDRVGC